jgi:hypothetical protein
VIEEVVVVVVVVSSDPPSSRGVREDMMRGRDVNWAAASPFSTLVLHRLHRPDLYMLEYEPRKRDTRGDGRTNAMIIM